VRNSPWPAPPGLRDYVTAESDDRAKVIYASLDRVQTANDPVDVAPGDARLTHPAAF
jgi:hypothetical protein